MLSTHALIITLHVLYSHQCPKPASENDRLCPPLHLGLMLMGNTSSSPAGYHAPNFTPVWLMLLGPRLAHPQAIQARVGRQLHPAKPCQSRYHSSPSRWYCSKRKGGIRPRCKRMNKEHREICSKTFE